MIPRIRQFGQRAGPLIRQVKNSNLGKEAAKEIGRRTEGFVIDSTKDAIENELSNDGDKELRKPAPKNARGALWFLFKKAPEILDAWVFQADKASAAQQANPRESRLEEEIDQGREDLLSDTIAGQAALQDEDSPEFDIEATFGKEAREQLDLDNPLLRGYLEQLEESTQQELVNLDLGTRHAAPLVFSSLVREENAEHRRLLEPSPVQSEPEYSSSSEFSVASELSPIESEAECSSASELSPDEPDSEPSAPSPGNSPASFRPW